MAVALLKIIYQHVWNYNVDNIIYNIVNSIVGLKLLHSN